MPATDPLSLSIAGAALAVAAAAGWARRRRDPDLDGERWFKTTLATLLRGRIEADGGGPDAWDAAVARIPYHPAGRWPERKVTHPEVAPPGPLLEGEAGLLERLARADDLAARWSVLYADEDALALLRDDPFELGAAYAPAQVARPGATWDDVAAWGAGDDAFGHAVLARLGARWVLAGGSAPRLTPHLQALAPDALVLPEGPEAARLALEGALERADTRLVLFAEGDAVPGVLQLLVDHAGLRDQVLAVVAVGGVIGGRTDIAEGPLTVASREDWMGRWFGQHHLDTGVVRLTPYMSVQWLDRTVAPPGLPGLPLQHQRFPPPAEQSATATTIESVDLGVLDHAGGPDDAVIAKALCFVVAGWVASRR